MVEKRPSWSLEADRLAPAEARSAHVEVSTEGSESWSEGPAYAPPRVVDLDGDGRGEILLQYEAGERSILRVFQVPRP